MNISVNGVRLFFDVDGAGFVPDGPIMREKPVMLLLHGGPGADHSLFKPSFSQLADLVQLVYLDHRGCGRSERGSVSSWNLTTQTRRGSAWVRRRWVHVRVSTM